jgi:hypothetical protein
MNVTKQHLQRFVELTREAVYDQSGDGEYNCGLGNLKKEYRNLGRRILKHIAEQMELAPGSYEIRWNPGGIACSGDHTLHTDKVYLALHDNIGLGWFYWRTCKGRKDYTGGANQVISWQSLLNNGLNMLIADMKKAQNA